MSRTQLEHLVQMASQIALNLGARRDEAAAATRTADHLLRFWTPAMRRRLLDYWHADGTLPAAVAAALRQIDEEDGDEIE